MNPQRTAIRLRTARRRLAGTVRVLAYAVFACSVLAALAARTVYADFAEGTLRAGRELEGLADVLGATKTVFINGTAMNVSTAFTDLDPVAVLDRFEALCQTHPQLLARALEDIPATMRDAAAKAAPDRRLRLAILRKEVDDEGALTCFTSDRPVTLRDLPARLNEFAASRDLSVFGRFRYVYVKRTRSGTHVRAVWTDGPFDVGRMFPAHGDAAGLDSPLTPRPPNARRILSATSAQVPYGVHAYDCAEPTEAVRDFYDREMASRGWRRVASTAKGSVLYMKDGVMVYATIARKGARTLVTTAETGVDGTGAQAALRVHD